MADTPEQRPVSTPTRFLERILYESAKEEGRRALSTFAIHEPYGMRHCAWAMGAAAEHLLGSLLAAGDPVLLGADSPSRVALSRANVTGGFDALAVKTVTWAEQLKILQLIHRSLPDLSGSLSVVMGTRNAAAHAAHVTQAQLAEAAVHLVRAVDALHAVSAERNSDDFWGAALSDAITQLRDERATAIQRRFASKVSHAQEALKVLLAGLTIDQQERQLNLLEQRGLPHIRDSAVYETVACPACNREGRLTLSHELVDLLRQEIEGDPDDGIIREYAVYSAQGVAVAFECPVCTLELESEEELEIASLSVVRDLEEHWQDADGEFDWDEPDVDEL